ncbi:MULTISPECIES: ABC transporter ATP-binding protein [unclassified Streptomyces]|uniref:ABC transporter ATP-binding protein n=1 Tax=unclassified Streptomyces TaxID=2593676 RepID=UPI0036EBD266
MTTRTQRADGGWSVLVRGLQIIKVAAREQPRAFTAGVVGSAVFGAATVGSAYVLSAVVARLATPSFRDGTFRPSAAVAAVLAVLAISGIKAGGIVVRRLAVGRQQFGLVAEYRRRILQRFLDASYAWHLRQSPGALLSTAGSDVDAAWLAVANLPLAAGALSICLLAVAALMLTDPVLATAGMAVFPLLIVINVGYTRRLSPHLRIAQHIRSELSGIAAESIDGAHVVHVLGRGEAEAARFRQTAERLRDQGIKAGRVRMTYEPLIDVLPSLGSLAMILAGAIRMRQGAIGVEQFLSSTLLFSAIAYPLGGLSGLLGLLPNSVVGWERLQNILAPAAEAPTAPSAVSVDARPETTAPAQLDVCEVSYRYDTQRAALDSVSVTVHPGETLAVAGTTGAGKSTLARIMVGLLTAERGTVLLDGSDCALTGRERVRYIGCVPQETFLFTGTVRSNLALDFSDQLSDDDLWAALRAAQAESFVAALPGKLDAEISERGGSLSGGQRQRVAIARALVHRPRLLVLDDATSNLDPAVEVAMMSALRASHPVTTVVVTDRSQSLALADRVIFLDGGRVVAQGRHHELVRSTPDYARLVHAHAEGAHS